MTSACSRPNSSLSSPGLDRRYWWSRVVEGRPASLPLPLPRPDSFIRNGGSAASEIRAKTAQVERPARNPPLPGQSPRSICTYRPNGLSPQVLDLTRDYRAPDKGRSVALHRRRARCYGARVMCGPARVAGAKECRIRAAARAVGGREYRAPGSGRYRALDRGRAGCYGARAMCVAALRR